jgi:hypothetical protein
MDLHFLVEALDSILKESGQSIVLFHMGSTVLVEVVVLAVTTVEQCLEGQDDVGVHCVDPVTPEEEDVQGTPDLAAILRGRILLHMLPCRSSGIVSMEDCPNLLRVSEERYVERAIGLKFLSSSDESASALRIGACKISSELMEEYGESTAPKGGSSTASVTWRMPRMT